MTPITPEYQPKPKGVWCPNEIHYAPIPQTAKNIWIEIYHLDDPDKGGCWASDQYLMEKVQIKKTVFYKYLKLLKELNLVVDIEQNTRGCIRRALIPDNPHSIRHLQKYAEKSNTKKRKSSTVA